MCKEIYYILYIKRIFTHTDSYICMHVCVIYVYMRFIIYIIYVYYDIYYRNCLMYLLPMYNTMYMYICMYLYLIDSISLKKSD